MRCTRALRLLFSECSIRPLSCFTFVNIGPKYFFFQMDVFKFFSAVCGPAASELAIGLLAASKLV